MALARSAETVEAAKKKDYPKLMMLAVLHMAQYFPAAFTGTALPFMFRQQGLPLEMFWLLALPGIPRWFKWIMALAVDNKYNKRIGRRKSWIIPCTLVGAGAYALLALFPPELDLVYIIVAILIFKSFVLACQDIAVDAYAAEGMQDHERPVGTSMINLMGAVAGTLGNATVILVDTFGWAPMMIAASALMLVAAAPAIIKKEPAPPPAAQKREARGERPNLWQAISRIDSRFIMPFLFIYGFGAAFFPSMVGPFLADKGLTLTEYGTFSVIVGVAGSFLAALVTPWCIERIGSRKTAMIAIAIVPFEACVYVYWSLNDLPALPLLIISVAGMSFSTALYNFAVTISRFRWASKAQAGTDYAVQSSFWNFGDWAARSLSGLVAGAVGWAIFFPIGAVFAIVAGLLYILLFDRVENMVRAREEIELQSEHASETRSEYKGEPGEEFAE